MYTTVRKPPLSSVKTAERPDGPHKNGGGVVGQTVPRAMVRGPKTVPTQSYVRHNSGGSLSLHIPHGGALPYQTTNALFTGSMAQGKVSIPSPRNSGCKNTSDATQEDISGGVGGGAKVRSDNARGATLNRRLTAKFSGKQGLSENMAAVPSGLTTENDDHMSNNVTRKVCSGPPSNRFQQNQAGDQLAQRPHPPGSGGPKGTSRQTQQFTLNTNGNQRLTPMPPRPLAGFSQTKNNLDMEQMSLRHSRKNHSSTTELFSTTRVFHDPGTQPTACSDAEGGQWNRTVSSSFALAPMKLQQLAPSKVSTPTASPSEAIHLQSSIGSLNGNKSVGSIEDTVNKSNLQYDFRVVASTGKVFNSPIKLTAAVGSLQGLRPTMEDEHFIRFNAATVAGQPISLLGILDGHCGRRVAELASKYVPDNFVAHSALGENNALAFVESIIQTDRAIFHALGRGVTSGGNGISSNGSGGSTLIAAAVHGRMLYVACLGDARAVLYDGNMTIPMSEDHKPMNRKEHTRILQCGGFVQFGRVCGVLAVSRALGDYEFKFNGNRFIANRELMVSNVADVRQINLTDSSKFLLMACDGLWDVVENEEATQFVRDFLSYTPDVGSSPEATKRALNNCCQKLAEFAVGRGSTDNVSVMLLFFHDVADVVAGFDRPISAVVSRPLTNLASPQLGNGSRGTAAGSLAFYRGVANSNNNGSNNNTSTNVAGDKHPLLNSTGVSWFGRTRAVW